MDTDLLKCNRMSCRRVLTDKAVVESSHIFCVGCANELFNAARLCPACESTLSEPDDVVVCSLHPSNDYKTSVLSGLSPSNILEICGRAISFWQYQIHQENSFQHAVVRNMSDKNAQVQKQLDNVIREANGEIGLLSSKISELERDLELERRRTRELQEASRERDKEYQKLKAQHDQIKRKALFAPNVHRQESNLSLGVNTSQIQERQSLGDRQEKSRSGMLFGNNAVNLGAVVGGMEANGIQRTPIVNRTLGVSQHNPPWSQVQNSQGQDQARNRAQQSFGVPSNRSFRAPSSSDRSDSADEVENLLLHNLQPTRRVDNQSGWVHPSQRPRPVQQHATVPTTSKRTGKFRPTGLPR